MVRQRTAREEAARDDEERRLSPTSTNAEQQQQQTAQKSNSNLSIPTKANDRLNSSFEKHTISNCRKTRGSDFDNDVELSPPQFIPENPFNENMLQMLNDEDSADVVFAVGKQPSKNNAEKVAKIAPVKFHAHCLILNNAGSAILAEFCDSKGDPSTPIEITDVSPEVFRHLLYYIWGKDFR